MVASLLLASSAPAVAHNCIFASSAGSSWSHAESIDALGAAISEFKGGVVLVSHDSRLIRDAGCDLWVCDHQNVKPYGGESPCSPIHITHCFHHRHRHHHHHHSLSDHLARAAGDLDDYKRTFLESIHADDMALDALIAKQREAEEAERLAAVREQARKLKEMRERKAAATAAAAAAAAAGSAAGGAASAAATGSATA